jgi:hypothetical protein
VLGRVPMFVRKWPWIDGRTESGNFEDFGFLALNEMVFFVLFKSILNCIPIVCARQLKRIGNQSHLAFEYFSVLDIETMFSIWSARILQTKNTWITKWRSLKEITEKVLNLRNVEKTDLVGMRVPASECEESKARRLWPLMERPQQHLQKN